MHAWMAILLCFKEFTIRNGSTIQKYNKYKNGIQTFLSFLLYFLIKIKLACTYSFSVSLGRLGTELLKWNDRIPEILSTVSQKLLKTKKRDVA